ncbi:MAG: ABC transporter substrate-binding protein [Candidatus Vecturithrix sp.]|jgi:peptide/nickel transport system substrate-binding protein|nr:ABC transporter substrate-binding protein [Candidatus Vecturithrix sp.]
MKKGVLVVFVMLLGVGVVAGSGWAERAGGSCTVAAPYGGDYFSLDPHITTRTQDYLVTMNIHHGLYKWDPDQNIPILSLPEKVDVSEDGLVHTYTLRDNIKFHNGRQLVVDDVIWSFERIMNPNTASPCSRRIRVIKGAQEFENGQADHITGLRKIDDLTLEVTLNEAINPGYPWYDPCAAILPREEVEKDPAAFGLSPIGCGPFKFVNWVKGSEVVLEKFPEYYETGKPYLDKLIYGVMTEPAARDVAFRAKELDVTIVDSAQYEAYESDPEIAKHLVEVAEMYTRCIGFNRDFKPFSDKRVRQAINYAIDSSLIIEKFLKKKAYAAIGFLATTSAAFNPDEKGYTYDPEKAKALMKEAGYEAGFEFTCIGATNKAWGTELLETLIPFLKAINVTINIQQVEGATLSQKVMNEQDWDAFIWSLDSGPDPLQALQRFHSENPQSGGNFVRYNNPEFDKLLDAAAQERDEVKKIELLQQANALFTEDAPMWFFNYNKAIIAAQPWVHGIKPVAVEHMYQNFADIWIDESSPRANEK